MRQRKTGFTLIELMITVAVVGILAAIAYPSYMDSVRASRRAEAINQLSAIALAQEKWRANSTTYTGTLGVGGLGWASATTDGGHYTLAVSTTVATAGTAFTATATPNGGQVHDTAGGVSCNPLTINQNGPVFGTSPPNQAPCWKRN